jgi:hypothetical protein
VNTWVRRVRAAVGMGLTWAVGWALVGFGIEEIHNIWPNPLGGLVDIWPAALAFPAFFSGLTFSAVLGIAGRRRRFNEFSIPRFAAWGAAGGLVVGLIPTAMIAVGLASLSNPPDNVWLITAMISGASASLSAVSAAGSLVLARKAEELPAQTGLGVVAPSASRSTALVS